jgi:AraC-like DNA-binding protein
VADRFFPDQANFTRAFRRLYAISLSEFLRQREDP